MTPPEKFSTTTSALAINSRATSKRRRVGKVECDAALVAIETEKCGALAADFRVLVVTRVVTAIRVFDLDDLGAEIGERLRAGRTGNDPGKVDDQQTIQGSRLALSRAVSAPAMVVWRS